MQTEIINGYQLAKQHQAKLKQQLAGLNLSQPVVIAAILFTEDKGSQLYTQLKKEMAESLGIEYRVFAFSVLTDINVVLEQIKVLNEEPNVTGIIIQKPWRKTWLEAQQTNKANFADWWHSLVTTLAENKDVDGLHPSNLASLATGDWLSHGRVLPATCQATLRLLEEAFKTDHLFSVLRNSQLKTVILGKSDLLGQPLFAILTAKKCDVEMIGSKELKLRIEQQKFLKDADVIVSATGRKDLITGNLVKLGCVIIDVGEPQGDVDLASVLNIARAVTPVPGGVGPMTVVSLMENAIKLAQA